MVRAGAQAAQQQCTGTIIPPPEDTVEWPCKRKLLIHDLYSWPCSKTRSCRHLGDIIESGSLKLAVALGQVDERSMFAGRTETARPTEIHPISYTWS